MNAIQLERLRWSFELGGASHQLDLLPEMAPKTVTLMLDGGVLAKVDKPSPEHPWVELPLSVAGETAVLTMVSRHGLETDLFVRGVSVIDGRSLDEARSSAPSPIRGYNRWFSGFGVWRRRPSRRDLGGAIVVLALGAAILTGVLLAQGRPLDRAIQGSVGVAVILLAWQVAVIGWMSAVAWVNTRLLQRRELNDALRLLLLGAAFVAIAAATVVAVVVALTVVR